MKRVLLSISLLVLFAACASNSSTIVEPGSGQSANRMSMTHYILLSDPGVVRTIDWSNPPLKLHVKGLMTTGGFKPYGAIEGSGKLCSDGQDWVSLSDGKFHASTDGATPSGPYVKGCKGSTGGFMPASREILN